MSVRKLAAVTIGVWAAVSAAASATGVTVATVDSSGRAVSLGAAEIDSPATDCAATSWTAGTTELCDGVVRYRDYVYDDYGADLGVIAPPGVLANLGTRGGPGQTSAAGLSPSAGDVTYPDAARNTADVVRIDLAIDGDQLGVEFELNTMFAPDQAIAALAIDTDNDASTGGGDWPGLGIRSDGWEVLETFTSGDPETNLIQGQVAIPPGEVWRVQAVVAQADGQVMNVAFRGPDEIAGAVPAQSAGTAYVDPDKGGWWEDKQAAALASGDISDFGEVVAVDHMQNGVTRPADVGAGLHQRVYTSAHTAGVGEGVSFEGEPGVFGRSGTPCEQLYHYLGKYQPYAVYLPDGTGPRGLQVQLHGCGDTHASQINEPGFQARFGDDPNRVIVSPLGRGPQGFYHHLAEADLLDVVSDSLARDDIDRDQVFISGTSMGGYGALRTAIVHPDLFAGVINWVGFTGNIANTPLPGNPLAELLDDVADSDLGPVGLRPGAGSDIEVPDLVGNLRNVPTANLYSSGDALVTFTTALALFERFDAAGVEHQSYLHTPAEHLTYVILDDWQKEADYLAGRRRNGIPARVTYRTDPIGEAPELGIVHDGAYWASDIVRRETAVSEIDAESFGCGNDRPEFESGVDAGTGPTPLTWVRQFRNIVGSTPVPAEPKLVLFLENIRSVTIDVEQTCLTGPFSYEVVSDGPASVSFTDGRTLVVPGAGEFEALLEPLHAGEPEATTPESTATLPATGGPSVVWIEFAFGLLVLSTGLRRLARPRRTD